MSNVDNKPLPSLPPPSRFAAPAPLLAVDSRTHLRAFLRHTLIEEGVIHASEEYPEEQSPSTVDAPPSWISELEGALDELGQRITSGGWLAGFRRARCALRTSLDAEEAKTRETATAKEEKKAQKEKERDEEKRKGADATAKDSSAVREASEHSTRTATSVVIKDTDAEAAAAAARKELSLHQLGELVSHPSPPTPKPSLRHLLLMVSQYSGSLVRSREDATWDQIPSRVGCSFAEGAFNVSPLGQISGTVLFGVEEWTEKLISAADGDPIAVVGGTFTLNGVASKAQYDSLCRVLRLASFMHMSLLLEQQTLLDFDVPLEFPAPPPLPLPSPPALMILSPPLTTDTPPTPISGHRRKGTPANLWSFLTKKRDDLFARAAESLPLVLPAPRGGSLDMRRTPSSGSPTGLPTGAQDDGSVLPRTFSFLSSPRPSVVSAPAPPAFDPPPEELFTATAERLRAGATLLSTTPGIAFAPPPLLTRLAAAEAANPARRVPGDEQTALAALAGWAGASRLARAKEMTAPVNAFVRHQGIVTLYSEHVPVPVLAPDSDASSAAVPQADAAGTATASAIVDPASGLSATSESAGPATAKLAAGAASAQPVIADTDTLLAQCTARRRPVAYRYYSRDTGASADRSLGEAVRAWCTNAARPCMRPGCAFKRGEHELRWIHAGTRITLKTHAPGAGKDGGAGEKDEGDTDGMRVWARCKICGKESAHRQAGDGTQMLSLGKFLELLVYAPALCIMRPALCEHTAPPAEPVPDADRPLPRARFNIVRFFGVGATAVSFALSRVEDVFELCVPRIQITRSGAPEKSAHGESSRLAEDEEKRLLRAEIKAWWQGVAEHLDRLEIHFDSVDGFHRKSLPRLPSEDDPDAEEDVPTPRPSPVAIISGLPQIFSGIEGDSVLSGSGGAPKSTGEAPNTAKRLPTDKTLPRDKALPLSSLDLLSRMREAFQKTEHDLYAELARTAAATLNDVRRSFYTAARGAKRRLGAWEDKHVPHKRGEAPTVDVLAAPEPAWFDRAYHAVPGGHVIVRDGDWGSIIAFTLSCTDYVRELASLTVSRASLAPSDVPSAATSPLPSPTPPSGLSKRSYFTAPFTRAANPKPDPDQDDVSWHEPETCSAVISRKQHPRDPRDPAQLFARVLEGGGSLPSQLLGGRARAGGAAPAAAYAKPAVELSTHAAGGEVDTQHTESAGQLLQELEAANADAVPSAFAPSVPSSSDFVETHIRRGKGPSLVSSSGSSVSGAESVGGGSTLSDHTIPAQPPSSWRMPGQSTDGSRSATPSESGEAHERADTHALSLTNTLANAVKFMLKAGGDTLRPPSAAAAAAAAKNHHALLSTDPLVIDERPHIKYDFTVGKMRFSCTAYYAKQFDVLRRRCGVEDVFLRSMQTSANWAADGGKSKSNFWKTADDRYIIKTLVNAWNVADLQVLLELGPAYFRYMNHTANRATMLAKLLGFYTVEVRNLESGTTQHKADLVIMENLFYDRKITKTFDLKGIQGRKIKAKGDSSASKTLFDGEWMEGQQRALTLIHPHSKAVLDEAIRNDCEFLAESNIMDYSLLLGIDPANKQIACGLVDTIGSYTFAKTLEYKAKQGLNPEKQVTVVPPLEYQQRFVSAMENYFLACPDKWSKPLDGPEVSGDPTSLPSVL